ncbi:MAG: hypothetical protein K2X81_04870 [Candidatus Obscuribacterales bacterium]|nr:hypothetical protein [Candidatus Obscuribacterales bacterium]
MNTTKTSDTTIITENTNNESSSKPTQPLEAYTQCAASANHVFDGLGNGRALIKVLNRVCLGSLVYTAVSSMFVYELVHAMHAPVYGMGPLEAAASNAVFVVYFTTIMVPIALFLSWCYRYKKSTPYQKQVLELNLPQKEAYELGLGAILSLSGSELISADETSGEILCKTPRRPKAGTQELKVNLETVAENRSRLIVSSQQMVNAVEYLLFGYTLAVDSGRNKANVDQIINFLKHKTAEV